MGSIGKLAKSRIRYNKSRTFLTMIAIMLTAMLLAGLGTSAVGLLDMQQQQAAWQGNMHAVFRNLKAEQVETLAHHVDLEAAQTNEIFATIEYEKMDGFLTCSSVLKEGLTFGVGNLLEGHEPRNADEICSSAAFFEQMGVEPEIGNTVTVTFRPQGEGEKITRTFTICGLISSVDLGKLEGVSEDRLTWGAHVSESLVEEFLSASERNYSVQVRVTGEESLNYDEMEARVNQMAADIGCDLERDVTLNREYLMTMTDPGTEMKGIVGGIALLIIFFAGIVIYSIYYVGVITDVQEIGKLKALGASEKQVKRMLMAEGMLESLIAVPIGIGLGYLIPYIAFPLVMDALAAGNINAAPIEEYHMFSWAVLLAVAVIVLITVYLSLLKPMRMASKISPVEAIRYQESSRGGKTRKGNEQVTIFRLICANLGRNKRRTIVTMLTMALSCVLFMSLAGVMNSMDAEDIARRQVVMGDFSLMLDYATNDETYPENNLDSLQRQDYFSADFLAQLSETDGVEAIFPQRTVLVGSDLDSELFAENDKSTLSYFNQEQMEKYEEELKQGGLDYEEMVQSNGAIYCNDVFMAEYGLEIGEEVPLVIVDGEREIPLTVTITASVDNNDSGSFLIPEEVWERLGLRSNTISGIYIDTDEEHYDEIKSQLRAIADANPHFSFYALDEEMKLGAMSVNMVKYPLYVILVMIAVIGFMNLINTMITSIVTRKRELGVLQAIGLSNHQLSKMLAGEGLVFTLVTLIAAFSLGNLLGYLVFLWAEENGFMSVSAYHYPLWETLGLLAVLIIGQLAVSGTINKLVHRESLIERIRSGE